MSPRLNRTGERALGAAAAIGAWLILSGCVLLRPPAPDPPPDINLEGCTNDHDDYWKPDEHAEIWGDESPADQPCNELGFFSGGGFQGGDVFHIEPKVALTFPPGDQPYAITYEVYAMNGEEVTGVGYELYPNLEDIENGVFTDNPELRFDEQWRGKNLHVVALITLLDENSEEYDLRTEAAFYLSHEN